MRKRLNSATNRDIRIFGKTYHLSTFLKSALVVNSFLVLIGNNLANFIAYVYHLVLGRILGPASYGDLAAFISVISLIGAGLSFFNLVIVKYSAIFDKEENVLFFNWIRKIAVITGIVGGFILIIFARSIGEFVNLDFEIALVIAPIIFLGIMTMVYRSFLQGLVRFKEVVISTNFELLMRLVLSLVFFYVGLEVFGVTLSFFVSSILGLWLTSHYMKDISSRKVYKKFRQRRNVFKYTVPVFISYVTTNSFFTTDVILAKHYLDPFQAGLYAALSSFGKVLFFSTAPVALVMFPLVAKKYKEGGDYRSLLYGSIVLSLAILFGVLGIYYFFPELMINILFGSQYLDASRYLFTFGIFISIVVIALLLINYFLSIDKTKIMYISIIASVLQIVGIVMFHEGIYQIISVSIASSLFLLTGSVIYLIIDSKHEKKN